MPDVFFFHNHWSWWEPMFLCVRGVYIKENARLPFQKKHQPVVLQRLKCALLSWLVRLGAACLVTAWRGPAQADCLRSKDRMGKGQNGDSNGFHYNNSGYCVYVLCTYIQQFGILCMCIVYIYTYAYFVSYTTIISNTYISTCTYRIVYRYRHICMYVCMYVCIYIYMSAYMT